MIKAHTCTTYSVAETIGDDLVEVDSEREDHEFDTIGELIRWADAAGFIGAECSSSTPYLGAWFTQRWNVYGGDQYRPHNGATEAESSLFFDTIDPIQWALYLAWCDATTP